MITFKEYIGKKFSVVPWWKLDIFRSAPIWNFPSSCKTTGKHWLWGRVRIVWGHVVERRERTWQNWDVRIPLRKPHLKSSVALVASWPSSQINNSARFWEREKNVASFRTVWSLFTKRNASCQSQAKVCIRTQRAALCHCHNLPLFKTSFAQTFVLSFLPHHNRPPSNSS